MPKPKPKPRKPTTPAEDAARVAAFAGDDEPQETEAPSAPVLVSSKPSKPGEKPPKPKGVRNVVWREGRGDEPGCWRSRLTVYVSPEMRRTIDLLALEEGMDISELAVGALERELKRRGKG